MEKNQIKTTNRTKEVEQTKKTKTIKSTKQKFLKSLNTEEEKLAYMTMGLKVDDNLKLERVGQEFAETKDFLAHLEARALNHRLENDPAYKKEKIIRRLKQI